MKTEYLKSAYYSPSTETVKELILFLEKCRGKSYKDNHISNYITKTKWQNKEGSTLFKVHIQVIIEYLNSLKFDLQEDQEIFKSIIADITEVFKQHENSLNEDLDWIMLSTNVLPSFIHFKHANSLFRDKKLGCELKRSNHYDLLSVFGARLALEKRVFSLLKIDYALINDKPISMSKILDLIQNLESIQFSDDLDWKLIIKVNTWLNHYIHRQLRPLPWVIWKVYHYLNVILESGVVEHNGKKIYSFYYSTIVVDEQKLDDEIQQKVKEEFGDIQIQWSHIREAVK
ncbi:MAG: hypothetical protein ACI8RP_001538 [Urechidicola sp.]|jgi:hypothetical protein